MKTEIRSNQKQYYIGNGPSNYYPFDNVNTCPIFTVPNFGTINWDIISPDEVKKNIQELKVSSDKIGKESKDNNKVYDEIMMYIHIPFCNSFCHYCNFARDKFPWKDKTVLDTYVDYLIKEIDFYLSRTPYVQEQKFTSFYIGGGSPSTLGAKNIDRLLSFLRSKITNYDSIEKTFTGEPKTVKHEDIIKVLVAHKIDRITFGVETTISKYKKVIGRTDTLSDVETLFANLSKNGFKGDTAADFMFNHPGQPYEDVVKDIQYIVNNFSPTEMDVYNTIYVPYRPLHKRILKGQAPQPANIRELMKMREYIYDYLLSANYNNVVAETYSKNKNRTQYQTAHCARQDIIGIGVAGRGNLKDMVSINPPSIEEWMKNIDSNNGPSTSNLQKIGRDGVFSRIMTMWPRYKELSKELFESYSDVKSYAFMKKTLSRHLELGVIEETDDCYRINKLGVLWHPNLQWDYMRPKINIWGKVIGQHFAEKKKNWDDNKRFNKTWAIRFMDYFTDKYPKLMK